MLNFFRLFKRKSTSAGEEIDFKLLEDLKKIKSESGRIPYSWAQIMELYMVSPKHFKKVWRKANNDRYHERPEFSQDLALWIACNIVDGSLTNKRCYYCHTPLIVTNSRDYALLTIEHLHPLDAGGTHTPGNVVNSCRFCNDLRDNLSDADLREIILYPRKFFAENRYSAEMMEKLMDFAEAYSYAVLTQEEFQARYESNRFQFTQVFFALKKRYREKWIR